MLNANHARTIAVALAAGTIASLAIAHDDDPKAQEKLKPYFGTGWRAGDGTDSPGDFEQVGTTLQSWLALGDFAPYGDHSSQFNDCWGYTAPSGREYALLGLECGTGVVEITDPTMATIIGYVGGPCSTWGDIKVFEQTDPEYHAYAYKTTESSQISLQVIDLSDVDNGNVTLINDFEQGMGIGASHNVVLNQETGHLFRTGGYHYGLGVYDLNADPVDPPLMGSWDDRYVHDAQVVVMESGPYAGHEVAFCCSGFSGGWSETGIDIVDIIDNGDGTVSFDLLSRYEYPTGAYSHQAWLSDDQQYFYLGDELDEGTFGIDTSTKVIDVSDLTLPLQVNDFTNGNPATGHNLYVRGSMIIEANYKSGIRVFDATDQENPVEVAYIDTYPEEEGSGYSGMWSAFPYFPSGTVIGSDRNRGLFVFQIDSSCSGDPDLTGDGNVDVSDLLAFLPEWGADPGSPADIDCDGDVDVSDLLLLLAAWGS